MFSDIACLIVELRKKGNFHPLKKKKKSLFWIYYTLQSSRKIEMPWFVLFRYLLLSPKQYYLEIVMHFQHFLAEYLKISVWSYLLLLCSTSLAQQLHLVLTSVKSQALAGQRVLLACVDSSSSIPVHCQCWHKGQVSKASQVTLLMSCF